VEAQALEAVQARAVILEILEMMTTSSSKLVLLNLAANLFLFPSLLEELLLLLLWPSLDFSSLLERTEATESISLWRSTITNDVQSFS